MFTAVDVAAVVLPATSVTVSVAVSAVPSPEITESAGQAPAMPDSASEQVQWIVTGPSYQPAPFGAVVGVPVNNGAVLSTLMSATVAVAVFPAVSIAVPVTDWPAPSSTETGAVQPATAIPEPESVHVNDTVTSVLFQPAVFAAGVWAP